MKRARGTGIVGVMAAYVDCPSCGEGFQYTSDGSMLVTREDLASLPPDYVCLGCGAIVALPRAKLRRLLG